MTQHEVITRGGNALLLRLHEGALSSGSMSEEQPFSLIGISSTHSDRVILAMKDYLVSSHSRGDVFEEYQMSNGYFSTTLGRLTRLGVSVARFVPHYTDSISAITGAASL